MAAIDMTGKRFGRLTVIKRTENGKYGDAFWVCKCDCGNIVKVMGYAMRSGHSKSCGCLQKDKARETAFKSGFISTGRTPWNKGIKKPAPKGMKRIYSMLSGMKQRCCNPSNAEYEYYGGRGITLCEEWDWHPDTFYKWAINNGYKDTLTIERIDNNKGYSPF